MITKYVTQSWNISALEVLRESEQCVWVKAYGGKERRQAKVSSYTRIHDSWEAARDFLLEKAERRLSMARSALQRAQDELGNVKGMKRPPA